MKVAYVDMIGGAAGDMLLGAWVDAGADVRELERALRTVVADGWELVTERVVRAGVNALHLDLLIPGEDDHGHHGGEPIHHRKHFHAPHGYKLSDVLAIVERSGLTPRQIERACTIYRRLSEASARVSGEDAGAAIFHAVGQLDAILDVAGSCVALDLLEIEDVRCSAFPRGTDTDETTFELLRERPLRAIDLSENLVTATAAAILTTLASDAPPRAMKVEKNGFGAGRRDFSVPNIVHVAIGEALD